MHYCDYHPVNEALWRCQDCGRSYCPDCMASRESRGVKEHACLHCSGRVQEIPVQFSRLSIWQRSRAILTLPLRRTLILICLVSGVFAMAAQWFSVPPLAIALMTPVLPIISGSVLAGVLARRSYKSFLLNDSSAISLIDKKETITVSAIVAGAMLIFGVLYGNQAFLSLSLYVCLLFFVMPPLLIMHIQSDNTQSEVWLNRFLQSVGYLGPNYMALGVWALMAYCAWLVLSDAAALFLPGSASAGVAAGLASYAILMCFSVLGFAAREVSKQKGQLSRSRRYARPHREVDAKLRIALVDGDYDKVLKLLENENHRQLTPDYRLEQMVSLLRAQKDWSRLSKSAPAYMQLLLSRGRISELMLFLKDLCSEQHEFRLRDPVLCQDVAEACVVAKEPKLLLWLIQDAHIRFPESAEQVVKLYRHAGRVLHKVFNDPEKALAYFNTAAKIENRVKKLSIDGLDPSW